ncbi:MAG: cytochrome c [Bauldia sp.]|nr:cytochrome c [Bauldia sp.]
MEDTPGERQALVSGKLWWIGAVAVAIAASGFFVFRASVAAADLRAGQTLYLANCASCHGVDLEGQPNWQTPLADGRFPAPPHDETGHTWHHSDAQLFAIVKFGMGAVVEGYGPSGMPAFSGLISDRDIENVLRFIKSNWPLREREYQRERTRERELP